MNHQRYESPLSTRYASDEMSQLFSSQYKYTLWRSLWIALAESQQALDLEISNEQIDELKKQREVIDFDNVRQYEEALKHDVMAHIHAYGDLCPKARPIIHLGATSCYVTDNADLIQMKEALLLLKKKLEAVISNFSTFATQYAALPCLGYTHFQPAQLTTVGKRVCLWMQDFLLDLEELNHRLQTLQFLGVKGTTGTQASFLKLFNGDHEKVKALDEMVTKKMGFTRCFALSGQTYSRKQDSHILHILSGLGASSHKCCTDIRLLANQKEIEEPFSDKQIGSSAMPYKRNPMLSERACSLARFLISLSANGYYTSATQWLERSLDDSANRRLTLSEAFLTSDALLNILLKLSRGLVVYPKTIEKNIREELPFMLTENILMAAVKKGGDRQDLHEKIRIHSQAAGQRVKEEGKANDLLDRIAKDPDFFLIQEDLHTLCEPKHYIGRADKQVEEFISTLASYEASEQLAISHPEL